MNPYKPSPLYNYDHRNVDLWHNYVSNCANSFGREPLIIRGHASTRLFDLFLICTRRTSYPLLDLMINVKGIRN